MLVRAACAGSLSRACQAVPTFLAASASPSGPGAPGVGAEVAGLLDPGAAFCLDLVVPGDVQAAARTVAGVKLPGFDPVVNDASAAAQAVGGFCDADLLGGGGRWRGGELAGAGGPAQVGGLLDPGAAAGLDLVVPGQAEPVSLSAAGGQLAGVDPVVATGSTSVGSTDRLRACLQRLRASLVVDGVDCRPGHPQLLARLDSRRWLVGLPGNPFAAFVSAYTLLSPLLVRWPRTFTGLVMLL